MKQVEGPEVHHHKNFGGKVIRKGGARRVAMRLAGDRYRNQGKRSTDGRRAYREVFPLHSG